MIIVGCDFHPSWQQIAVLDTETGEVAEHKLINGDGEAERFYRGLPAPSLIGLEACGNSQWLFELLQGLGHEVWIGDAAQIRASYGGKLILYHGWNDPAIPAVNTVNYYEEVIGSVGRANVDSFVRLYMVPGMQHCFGGPGADEFRAGFHLDFRSAAERPDSSGKLGGEGDRARRDHRQQD